MHLVSVLLYCLNPDFVPTFCFCFFCIFLLSSYYSNIHISKKRKKVSFFHTLFLINIFSYLTFYIHLCLTKYTFLANNNNREIQIHTYILV